MTTTGTSAIAVRSQLVTLLQARTGLDGVAVNYGAPKNASDVTDDNGELRAIWLGDIPQATVTYPILVGTVAKPVDETYRFIVVCQAVVRSEDPDVDGQLDADTQAVALMYEVHSAIAADVTLGLTSPRPTVSPGDWALAQLERDVNAWGARVEMLVRVDWNRIYPPS